MLDESFLRRLEDMARKPQLLEVGDHLMVLRGEGDLEHVRPKPTPKVATLRLHSLTALVAYLQANRDGLFLGDLVLHVSSPQQVELLGPITGDDYVRQVHAVATCEDLAEPFLEKPWGQTEFQVGLLTRFQQDAGDDRAQLLALTAKLTQEQTYEEHADGVGMTVTAKKGVHLAAQVQVPMPAWLTGWRTFREADQPRQPFMLSFKGGQNGSPVTLTLRELDGGAWELQARDSIRRWLEVAQQQAQSELPEDERRPPVPVLA